MMNRDMVNKSRLKIMIMAGGTGGHVFPALAVAREFQTGEADVFWLGTKRGIEARVVPEAGIELFTLPVQGVRGRGILGLLKAPGLILSALWQACRVLRSSRPDLVLGFGGFASGPGGIAARFLGKPLVIHEQNAVAGTTNRLLARIATRVLTAFPNVLEHAVVVGNPVRADIANLPAPEERFAGRNGSEAPRLLVLGGSLGARFINQLVAPALAELTEQQRPRVWHQAGREHAADTRTLYEEHKIAARVDDFIEDMGEAYAWADIVICRAGALTVSELMAVGVAALLIPFPHAIDDHQTRNAAVLVEAGAALARAQSDLSPTELAELLSGAFALPEQRLVMAQRGRQLAQPKAAQTVVHHCLEVAHG